MKTRETIKELAALIAANNETIKPEAVIKANNILLSLGQKPFRQV